jgi:cytochrome c biogenesis protein CcmG/thiol:disulfide interchange protein DsbE
MKRLIPLGIFGVLIVFLVIGLSLKPKEIPSPLIGKVAPTFSLPVLNQENQIFTPSEMLGKVWLLNVWASWCVSCRA